MAKTRIKTWVSEILTAADLNAEFDNLLSSPMDLISPATAALDMNGYEIVLDADGDSSLTADTDDVLHVRLKGIDAFIFDGDVASPVNGLTFTSSATGSPVSLTSHGSDTNIDIDIIGKGAADFTVNLGAIDAFVVDGSTASIVNGLTLTASATGSPVDLAATGSDSNIGMTLTPKGTGTIRPGTKFDLNATELILDADADSSITVDTDDVLHLRLQAFDAFIFDGDVASPVNGITFTASATGVGPTITPHGETNVSLTITPKGTGAVTVDMNGGELIFDADADSSITVDTDDVLHMRLQAFDAFIFDGNVASPAQGLTFVSEVSGTAPQILSHGAAADIGINLVPKGTGTIQYDGNAIHHVGEDFSSADQTLAGSSETIAVSHSLGAIPKEYWGVLRCDSAEMGYAVGEETNAVSNQNLGSSSGLVVSATATQVIANVMAAGAVAVNKLSGALEAIDNSKWKLILRARLT